MLAPTSRRVSMACSWRGRSSMITVTSPGSPPLRSAILRTTSSSGSLEAEQVGGPRAGGDLLHVEDGPGIEHRAALRERDHREGRGHPPGGQGGPLERIDRDVHSWRAAVADLLAVVEHRRLVLLALADHDDAVHRHGVEHQPHRVDRGAVGALLLAAADPAAGGERARLGDADELERQVAVRMRRVPEVVRDHVLVGLGHGVRGYAAEPLERGGRFSLGARRRSPPRGSLPRRRSRSRPAGPASSRSARLDLEAVLGLVDEPVERDQHEGGEADDRGHLAAGPGQRMSADHDPGEDEGRGRGGDQQPARRSGTCPRRCSSSCRPRRPSWPDRCRAGRRSGRSRASTTRGRG